MKSIELICGRSPADMKKWILLVQPVDFVEFVAAMQNLAPEGA